MTSQEAKTALNQSMGDAAAKLSRIIELTKNQPIPLEKPEAAEVLNLLVQTVGELSKQIALLQLV